MPSQRPRSAAEALPHASQLIWIAICVSIVFHGMVATLAEPADPLESMQSSGNLGFLIWAVAVAITVMSVFIHRRMDSDGYVQQEWEKSAVQVHAPDASHPHPQLEHLALRVDQVARRSFVGHLIVFALNDAISVLGVVYAFLSKDPVQAVPLCGLALVLNLLSYPQVGKTVTTAKNWARQEVRNIA